MLNNFYTNIPSYRRNPPPGLPPAGQARLTAEQRHVLEKHLMATPQRDAKVDGQSKGSDR